MERLELDYKLTSDELARSVRFQRVANRRYGLRTRWTWSTALTLIVGAAVMLVFWTLLAAAGEVDGWVGLVVVPLWLGAMIGGRYGWFWSLMPRDSTTSLWVAGATPASHVALDEEGVTVGRRRRTLIGLWVTPRQQSWNALLMAIAGDRELLLRFAGATALLLPLRAFPSRAAFDEVARLATSSARSLALSPDEAASLVPQTHWQAVRDRLMTQLILGGVLTAVVVVAVYVVNTR